MLPSAAIWPISERIASAARIARGEARDAPTPYNTAPFGSIKNLRGVPRQLAISRKLSPLALLPEIRPASALPRHTASSTLVAEVAVGEAPTIRRAPGKASCAMKSSMLVVPYCTLRPTVSLGFEIPLDSNETIQ